MPLIVKVSSKGERPKWGKESEKPLWWPTDIPWASVKTDPRASVEEKRKVSSINAYNLASLSKHFLQLSWTEALRKIIISCYQFYGRQDLLDASDIKSGQWRKALQIADMNISLDDCSLDEIGMEQSSEEDETELVTNGKRKKSTKGTGGKSRKKKFVETSGSPVGNSHRSTPTPTTCVLPGIQIVCGGSGSGLDHMDKIEFHRESPTSSTEKPETTSEDSQSPQHFEPTLFLNNSTEDVPKERVNDTRTPQRHVEIEGELYAMSETSDLLTKISSPPILYIRDGVPLRFVQMSENANDQFPEPSETLL